jgi:putative transposase
MLERQKEQMGFIPN